MWGRVSDPPRSSAARREGMHGQAAAIRDHGLTGSETRSHTSQESGMTDKAELVQNAAGRMVPTMVNGKPQIPYLGVAKYQPRGRKAAPPVRSARTIPTTATNAFRILRLRCASAGCAMAW